MPCVSTRSVKTASKDATLSIDAIALDQTSALHPQPLLPQLRRGKLLRGSMKLGTAGARPAGACGGKAIPLKRPAVSVITSGLPTIQSYETPLKRVMRELLDGGVGVQPSVVITDGGRCEWIARLV
jgi:hypothetical protein